jgi:two-component system sensor histidine kinase BarA
MSRTTGRRGISIRARMILLTLVPLLTATLVIGGYTLQARLGDVRDDLDQRGQIVAANLAMAGELHLLTRNLARLEELCGTALHHPDVVWAAVRDGEGRLLAGSRGERPGQARGKLYQAPMGTSGVPISDFTGETAPEDPPPPLGWAEVEISLAGTSVQERRIVTTTLVIAGGGLLLSLLAALRIGGGISRPLLTLSETMRRYRQGDLNARIEDRATGEIGELIQDFNHMAAELARSQSLLREEIDAATAELQRTIAALSAKNAELEAARQAALRAGQEKYEFLARMSHEIRTPLNAVLGFSRLVRDDAGGQGVREYTQTIERAANQLLVVIDGVLSFTKLESGNLELEQIPFDLRACLEDVVAMLSPAAHEKGLELALVLHHDIPETLVGDPNRIAQVLMNLVSNAIKFTAAGHVLVEAGYSEAKAEAGAGSIRVVVSDTGIGLTPEARERLFQPFAQADSSVTRRYGGTGLGLVISQRLVELMGGAIEVDSTPGAGSRFAFSIPCGPAPELIPALDAGPLAGRRVLVYDRHPVPLRALRTALVGWSLRVFNTARPERIPTMLANASERGEPFELLILGLATEESRPGPFSELVATVRPCYAGPLLVLVGADRWEVPEAARRTGTLVWTTKPVRRSLLYRILCRLTGQEQPEPDAMPPAARPRLAGQRVLLVEDNDFNRLLMRRLLELRGLDVHEARDGLEAIAAARTERFDLIFMDIHMPGMDGLETARRIRAQAGEQPCPAILALSADVFAVKRAPDEVPALDGFLLKPISEPALDQVLTRLLAPSGTPGPSARPGGGTVANAPPARPALPEDMHERLHQEIATLCDRLEPAIAAGDRPAVRELAHELKGLCGYFGLSDLQHAVRALEAAAAQASQADLQARLSTLRQLAAGEQEGSPVTDRQPSPQ